MYILDFRNKPKPELLVDMGERSKEPCHKISVCITDKTKRENIDIITSQASLEESPHQR